MAFELRQFLFRVWFMDFRERQTTSVLGSGPVVSRDIPQCPVPLAALKDWVLNTDNIYI